MDRKTWPTRKRRRHEERLGRTQTRNVVSVHWPSPWFDGDDVCVSELEIHLRDLGRPVVDAWNREFAGIPSVRVSCGDIFSTKSGPIAANDPIDVKADAIVSPANSFGFMDGGIVGSRSARRTSAS
jgi:hypothetical protein